MAESNRVTLAGGLIELSGRLSEEDQGALRAILESAAVGLAPDGTEPEVEGFTMDGSKNQLDTMGDLSSLQQMRMQTYLDRRSKAYETLSNVMKKMSDTSSAITQNLK
jgi:hypothetical protein